MRSKCVFLFPLVTLALLLSGCGSAGGAANRTLTVTGQGTVYLMPDIAYLQVGVHTENADVLSAVWENNRRTDAVVKAIKRMGVAAEDIRTSNFSLWTRGGYCGDDLTYTVDNTVYITIRDLSQVSAFLNTVVASGANSITGLSFDVADKSTALVQARQKAMEDALNLATELAQLAGWKLGAVQSVTYSEDYYSPYSMADYALAQVAEEWPDVPIQTGLIQVRAIVTVTYDLIK